MEEQLQPTTNPFDIAPRYAYGDQVFLLGKENDNMLLLRGRVVGINSTAHPVDGWETRKPGEPDSFRYTLLVNYPPSHDGRTATSVEAGVHALPGEAFEDWVRMSKVDVENAQAACEAYHNSILPDIPSEA